MSRGVGPSDGPAEMTFPVDLSKEDRAWIHNQCKVPTPISRSNPLPPPPPPPFNLIRLPFGCFGVLGLWLIVPKVIGLRSKSHGINDRRQLVLTRLRAPPPPKQPLRASKQQPRGSVSSGAAGSARASDDPASWLSSEAAAAKGLAGWACLVCTFVNSQQLGTACGMCATPKGSRAAPAQRQAAEAKAEVEHPKHPYSWLGVSVISTSSQAFPSYIILLMPRGGALYLGPRVDKCL